MRRLAVFASGSGTNFEAIVSACEQGVTGGEVVLMVCDKPGARVVERAAAHGVETFVFAPKEYASKADYEREIVRLLDAAGVAVPEEMDGESMLPLFRSGKSRGWRQSLYYQYYDYPAVGNVRAHYGVRTHRYKLIHWFGPGADGDPDIDFWELYDLRKDPCEVHNVYEERGYLPIRRELARLLAEKRGELGIR